MMAEQSPTTPTPGSIYAGHGAAPKPVAKVNAAGGDGTRIVGWRYRDEWPGLHQLPDDPLAQVAEIERLRADRLLLACAALGITPDSLVQTDADVAETEERIRATAERAVQEAGQ